MAAVRELILLKLGGSLLTDKVHERALRSDVLERLAAEIAAARAARPDMQLVIGHGSGSFGHMVASRHGTHAGVHGPEGWRGYAETALAAAALNGKVAEALWAAGVPVLRIQPSASALCEDGELVSLDVRPICTALANDLAPVVYGDVALDRVRGGTIVSTERLFAWLSRRLRPSRVILVGEVAGVFSAHPGSDVHGEVIPEVSAATAALLTESLGPSRGVDVTGGMLGKVREMLALLDGAPSVSTVQIISGQAPGIVRSVLIDAENRTGTRIVRAL